MYGCELFPRVPVLGGGVQRETKNHNFVWVRLLHLDLFRTPHNRSSPKPQSVAKPCSLSPRRLLSGSRPAAQASGLGNPKIACPIGKGVCTPQRLVHIRVAYLLPTWFTSWPFAQKAPKSWLVQPELEPNLALQASRKRLRPSPGSKRIHALDSHLTSWRQKADKGVPKPCRASMGGLPFQVCLGLPTNLPPGTVLMSPKPTAQREHTPTEPSSLANSSLQPFQARVPLSGWE